MTQKQPVWQQEPLPGLVSCQRITTQKTLAKRSFQSNSEYVKWPALTESDHWLPMLRSHPGLMTCDVLGMRQPFKTLPTSAKCCHPYIGLSRTEPIICPIQGAGYASKALYGHQVPEGLVSFTPFTCTVTEIIWGGTSPGPIPGQNWAAGGGDHRQGLLCCGPLAVEFTLPGGLPASTYMHLQEVHEKDRALQTDI